jgi:hypothetical protein
MHYKLSRPHRFAEGDKIKHADTTDARDNILDVVELTVRIVGDGFAYPSYTLADVYDDRVEDVLCTTDLVLVERGALSRLDAFTYIVEPDPRGGYNVKLRNGVYVSGPHPSKQYADDKAAMLNEREGALAD